MAKEEKKDNDLLKMVMEITGEFNFRTIYGRVHTKTEGVYEPIDELHFRLFIIQQFIERNKILLLNTYGIKEIAYLLEGITMVPAEDVNPEEYFRFKNGALKLNDDGLVELLQNEALIFTHSSQVPFTKNSDPSIAQHYLNQIIPAENEQKFLLEGLATAMFHQLRHIANYDHYLICFGSGSNGKSIFFENIVTPIFGEKTVSNTTVEELKNRFNLFPLLGCRLNIATENSESYISEHKQLKAITSGDRQQVERKHRDSFYAKIFIVPFFCVNQEPQIGNVSHAMKRRLKIVNFPNRFSDNPGDLEYKADPELKNPNSKKISDIQQGMITLIVNTAARLMKDRKLTKGDLTTIEEFQLASSHIREYINDFYIFNRAKTKPTCDVFKNYKHYCIQEGLYEEKYNRWIDPSKYDTVAKTPSQLSRRLRRFFPDQIWLGRNNHGRFIGGLEIKSQKKFELDSPEFEKTLASTQQLKKRMIP